MLSSERLKPSQSKRRRIFEGAKLEQTIAAAAEPWRTLFTLAALTGARVSELLATSWVDIQLTDGDDAEIQFAWQVDRRGQRQPTKTDGSARTVPIPRELPLIMVRHKLASRFTKPADFVFCTRTDGRLRQRNVGHALRIAQRDAVDDHGRPTFPALHVPAKRGKPAMVAYGELPSMHGFRHTVASQSFHFGDPQAPLKVSCKRHAGGLTISESTRSRHTPLSKVVGSRLRIGIVRAASDTAGGQLSVTFTHGSEHAFRRQLSSTGPSLDQQAGVVW